MGTTVALGMAEAVADGNVSLRQALHYHLTANHFPAVHPDFIPSAEEAIALYNAGEYSTRITMPNGQVRTASFIVEGLHLDAFLASDDEDEWDEWDDAEDEDDGTYFIIRIYEGDTPTEIIETGLSLEEAQAHCQDPATRGVTAEGERWFDGYEAE